MTSVLGSDGVFEDFGTESTLDGQSVVGSDPVSYTHLTLPTILRV